ncbi:MAG: GNAT family N-acetyltransferase [Limnoraphis robusta]|jgi:GNAT superfamily N-acetyltransferase|uniref:Acetyltransferase n=2 Tax=Limnoraphis robusta TaxID=1118279 RepID=A0A0F5Y8M6_9CYAN|nr:GNAT family N-acetyltransferase [Limnoraphis robusta]KKD35103.1 acetyltransferase [Limnoraphis robusta CS-951]MEA5517663.1 GNAT family N-acetyltransferase [Limnoraphis robusta CCNP1315]MEA5548879.1 GNAT family N-acetyltransferase [Limnoraphis robusta CCNP1324]
MVSNQSEQLQLKITIARQEDLSLLNHLYSQMDDLPLLSDDQIEELFNKINQIPNYKIYLVWLEEKAVGTFSLLYVPTMMHRGFHQFAVLDAVSVDSVYRSQGIGKAMIRTALKLSAEAGCYKVTLSSNLHRDRAHAFYESLGFQQHGWSFSLKVVPEV